MQVMSPEKPPLQDSGGGVNGNGNLNTVTQIIEPQNMVLTAIPTETNHIITTQTGQQQHQQHRSMTNQQHQQPQQIIVNGNNYATIHNGINSQNTLTGVHHHRLKTFTTSSINSSSSPKYVLFHQNGTSQYASVTTESPSATTFITTAQSPAIAQQSSNNVGNIVVLATEQIVEPIVGTNHLKRGSSNGTDEDLTPLTWLHDKNLINNIVSYSTNNNKSGTVSPVRQSNNNNGTLSPTSDFLEESCISEDNASSANSSSDQGISIHTSDFSPVITTNNEIGGNIHQNNHQEQQQNGYTPVHHHIQYATSTPNNNNNNLASKNRNHIISPSSTFSTSSQSQQQDVVINGNLPSAGTTTTVHVGPSGTTTVVEYKTSSNYTSSPRNFSHNQQQQQNQQLQNSSSPVSSKISPPPQNTMFVCQTNQTSNSTTSTSTPTQMSTTTTTSYHQQHFHKKYLREQMKGVEKNNFSNSDNNQIISAGNSSNRQPLIVSTNQASIINEENKEFHYTSPSKAVSTGSSFSAVNGQDDLLNEGINFENQSQGNGSSKSSSKQNSVSPKQKLTTNLPYDPQVHTHNKPPYSFSSLIFMAIEDSPHKALPVKEIYAWIVQHFPYFKTAPTGWKNSVRHNLSLNKSFLKVEKAPNMGKGSLWRVEESQRQNLIQALTRSPFYPCPAVDKISPSLKSPSATPQNRNNNNSCTTENSQETPVKTLDSKLFPKLSKMIKDMVNKGNYKPSPGGTEATTIEQDECHDQHIVAIGESSTCNVNGGITSSFETIERLARDCGADNIDDVNAAAAMLALKHGPKVFSETFQNGSPVITSSPSEDHTYSAGNGGTSTGNNSNNTSENNSNCNSSDGAFDSRGGSPIPHHQMHQVHHQAYHHITPEELEEQRRHAEGVDALLSFASKVSSMSSSAASSPVKRSSSVSLGEEDHILMYGENKSILRVGTTSGTSEDDAPPIPIITSNQRQQAPFNAEAGYYNNLLSPSPAKKLKTSRNIRTKIKRKATWIR